MSIDKEKRDRLISEGLFLAMTFGKAKTLMLQGNSEELKKLKKLTQAEINFVIVSEWADQQDDHILELLLARLENTLERRQKNRDQFTPYR